MIQKTAVQSFSINLQYYTYEKSNITLKNANDETLIDASITQERLFQFTMDIQASTGKEIKEQAKPFLKFLDKNLLSKGDFPSQPDLNGQGITLDLFKKDGYWGVEKTAQRIIDFVVNGAGDNIEKLKAGREGILRGLKEAEKSWGGDLPDISYQTVDKALMSIDDQLQKLNGNLINIVT